MADNISTFLTETKTDVEAVQYSAATAFPRVWIVPAVDLAKLLKIPRWPTALINDAGGQLDPVNGKIWTRRLDITIIDSVPRDHVGEQSTLKVLALGNALVTALEHNSNDAIYLAADSDLQALPYGTMLMMLTKTYSFEYQLQRS